MFWGLKKVNLGCPNKNFLDILKKIAISKQRQASYRIINNLNWWFYVCAVHLLRTSLYDDVGRGNILDLPAGNPQKQFPFQIKDGNKQSK